AVVEVRPSGWRVHDDKLRPGLRPDLLDDAARLDLSTAIVDDNHTQRLRQPRRATQAVDRSEKVVSVVARWDDHRYRSIREVGAPTHGQTSLRLRAEFDH